MKGCSHNNIRIAAFRRETVVITVAENLKKIFWKENAIWLAFGKKIVHWLHLINKTKHIYYTLASWNYLVKVVPNLGSLEKYVSVLFVYIFKAWRSVNVGRWGLTQVIMEHWMC